jgi:denticleless
VGLTAGYTPTTPYPDTLVTRLNPDPLLPPSIILIPSLHPWDHPRDYAPPLAVAFSHAAKAYSAQDAKRRSRRRLIAIAAEEGGVRVVDADEPVGMFRDSQGWFWRAHGNAVLDVKWSADDSKIVRVSRLALASVA